MKNVLFVASEAVPFIKTGGLADVVGALPKCFDKRYYDVRVMIPKYLCISEKYRNEMEYVKIAVALAHRPEQLALNRQRMRSHLEISRLMDAKGYMKGVEGIYRSLWHAFCAKGDRWAMKKSSKKQ